jgi:membrane fusion protein (multidrug efflux system)
MKKAIVIIIVLAILAAIVYRIATYHKTQVAQSIQDIQKQQGVPVEVLTVQQDTLTYTRDFSSTVEGFYQTSAVTHLMESVKEVRVKVGESVSAKDVLIVLDQTNPQAQFQQARLARDNARQEYDRVKALYDKGAVSRQMYDQVTLAKDIAETNFSNARELVEITAPIAGVVTDVKVKEGQVVNPGQPVVTISATDKVKCEFWVGDADRQLIKTGQMAQFITSNQNLESTSQEELMGKVSEVALSADPESHLYKVTVVADNTKAELRPGQLITVVVTVETVPNVLLIPYDAVILKNDKPFMYKVNNGIAQSIPIALGRKNRNHVEVVNGLSLGDSIVVYGMNRLKSGDKVQIVTLTGEAE